MKNTAAGRLLTHFLSLTTFDPKEELQLAGEATRVHNNNNIRKVFVILQERKKTQGKVLDVNEGRRKHN